MSLSFVVNSILFVFFYSIFLLDYLHAELHVLPEQAKYIIELLSISISFISLIIIAINKKFYLPFKYFIIFCIYFLFIIISAAYNHTDPLSLIIGVRAYFKGLPLLILPIAYNFKEYEIKRQFLVIFPLLILQAPIAFYQKFVKYADVSTGDVIVGTLQVSSQLTIIALAAISILYALYLKKEVSIKNLALTALILFLPTTINETKVTLFFLPIIFLIPAIIIDSKVIGEKIRKYMTFAVFCIILTAIFVPIYNYVDYRSKGDLEDLKLKRYLTDQNEFKKYFFKGATNAENQDVRRFDAIMLAINNITKDFGQSIFGKGIGNVQDTKIRKLGRRQIDRLQYKADYITLSILLWETGFSGTILFIILILTIMKDCYNLRNDNGVFGAFGIGMFTNFTIFLFCIIYTNFMQLHVMNYLFWFYSGVVICRKRYLQIIGTSARNNKTISIPPG